MNEQRLKQLFDEFLKDFDSDLDSLPSIVDIMESLDVDNPLELLNNRDFENLLVKNLDDLVSYSFIVYKDDVLDDYERMIAIHHEDFGWLSTIDQKMFSSMDLYETEEELEKSLNDIQKTIQKAHDELLLKLITIVEKTLQQFEE